MSAAARIGIYVHHHGGGHAARCGAIGAALGGLGVEVTYLSSYPAEVLGPGEVVELPLDTDLGPDPGKTPQELHFAPLGSAGLAGRMAAIAGWIERARPDLMLVDVSVEVAMLARLCGVPFVYARQTGDRDDPPHALAYRWAAGLLAPWPERLEAGATPAWVREGSTYVGAITRFDGAPRPDHGGRPRRALVLVDSGLAEEIAVGARGWEVLGPRPVDLELLARTAVVVAPGGANVVAETAFARCGLVCLPQPRPFGEQAARGAALAREAAAVVLDAPPADPTEWPLLLEEARDRRPLLESWADGEGVARAAHYLSALARASSVPAPSSQSSSPAADSSASQPLAGQSSQRSR